MNRFLLILAVIALPALTLAGCSPFYYRHAHYPASPPPGAYYPPAVPQYADTLIRPPASSEERELRRLLHELKYISENLLPQARYAAISDARIRFDWHQLEVDLMRVESGIESYLAGGVPAPRTIAPIAGDYAR